MEIHVKEKMMYNKILLIELAGIGDSVMASAAVRTLRESFPRADIAILSLNRVRGLLRNCPYLNQLFTVEEDLASVSALRRNLSTLLRLKRQRFDLAVNLYNLYSLPGALKMRLLLAWIGAKQTLGRNTDGKGGFYDLKVDDSINWQKHQVEYIMDVVSRLGCRPGDWRLEVWTDEEDRKLAQEFLSRNSVSAQDLLIGLHPGAERLCRRWPVENFAQVADSLIARYKAKIVITGSSKELSLAERLKSLMQAEPILASGRLSLSATSALIKRCNLYIANDTGPMHIANAQGVPLVAIMGSGPEELGPYQRDNCLVLRKGAACSPCYKSSCRSLICMKSILPDEVVKAAGNLLSARP